mgnify:CR=1 FL=1
MESIYHDADIQEGDGLTKASPTAVPLPNDTDFSTASINHSLEAEEKIRFFSQMLRIRRFEERSLRAYQQGHIGGFLHLYIGQEAVAVGSVSVMSQDDHVITAYRDHGHAIAVGMEMDECMAELYGKKTGCSKGKGGSMHFFAPDKNFWGGHGIVGGQIPLGAGLAFADKYFERDGVTLTYFGDGAARQGSLHETFNMAINWKLPVVFICENNGYAMGTSVERTANHEDIWKLGLGYEMPCGPVDGMNPVKVAEAMEEAIERARRGDGPTLLDIKTYRYRGHSMSDAQHYRTKDEVNEYRKIDPITQVLEVIKTKKYATDAQIKTWDKEVKDKVWNRDGGKCVECGSNEKLEFDHIIPFSKGGSNTYRNIQLLCEECNRKKSNQIG